MQSRPRPKRRKFASTKDVVMPANPVSLDIVYFDVILGTDWLHYNLANIDCYGKTVTFHRPGLPKVTFVGERSGVRDIWLMWC